MLSYAPICEHNMFPASRWAARLSRQSIALPRRSIATKPSGITRKTPRASLPQSNRSKEQGVNNLYTRDSGYDYQSRLQRLAQNNDALHQQQNVALESTPPNDLLAPVHIPSDPLSILPPEHPATSILANSTIVVQRQLEMMNVMLGFEQANKYAIMDGAGNHIGYLAEPDGNMLKRQMFKTHRAFTVHVFDRQEREVLRITRPFTWINSRIGVYDAWSADPTLSMADGGAMAQVNSRQTSDMRVIGEVQQQWAPLRRKYNLFLNRPPEAAEKDTPQLTSGDLPLSNSTALTTVDDSHRQVNMSQWAYCDEPFLSWDFSLRSEDNRLLGSVNRNFAGWGREIFTDTGVYALRMDSASLNEEPRHLISHTGEGQHAETTAVGMTLDQRAVMLATAVSIDFDYFSRKSGSGGFFPIPMWMPWYGGGAAEAGAAGGAAEAGAAGVGGVAEAGGIGSEVGAAARGAGALGAGEAGAAGAGSIAGYEAMQRGFGRGGDDASPTAQDPYNPQQPVEPGQEQGEEFWGERSPWDQDEQNPWGGQGGDQSPWGGGGQSGGGGGGGGDGGGGFDWGDWF